jgi:serine/threonine-protein kinase
VAPEALSGELVGEQADLYSLATIAYNLLTETLPFPGSSPRELFQQLLTQDPLPLNQAVKGVKFPPEMEAALMKALERDRAKRWKTVREFADAFCGAASDTKPKKEGFFSNLFRRGEG